MLKNVQWNFKELNAVDISRLNNNIVDSISCMLWQTFRILALEAEIHPTPISERLHDVCADDEASLMNASVSEKTTKISNQTIRAFKTFRSLYDWLDSLPPPVETGGYLLYKICYCNS